MARVFDCRVSVAGDGIGVGQIDNHAGSCADELGGQTGECVGDLVDGIRFAEAAQGVAAPAVEVCASEEQER